MDFFPSHLFEMKDKIFYEGTKIKASACIAKYKPGPAVYIRFIKTVADAEALIFFR